MRQTNERIGVLDLQGAVAEHLTMLELCGVQAVAVKRANELEGLQGLIVPGGESTAIGKLMVKYGFVEGIKELVSKEFPIYGTCAGLILLAKRLTEGDQPLLGLMDIEVKRNAFGRQVDSFEASLDIPSLGAKPFPGVFIRAPWIEEVGPTVKVMSRYRDKAIMAQEGALLVTAFHPELTSDPRIHRYFVEMTRKFVSVSETSERK
jgi:5'-phosphate synthase pdxT subunit